MILTEPNPIQPPPHTLSYPIQLNLTQIHKSDSILNFNLALLAGALEDMREVADGDAEREIERGEHDGEEDPPAGQGGDKGEGAARLTRAEYNQLSWHFSFTLCV